MFIILDVKILFFVRLPLYRICTVKSFIIIGQTSEGKWKESADGFPSEIGGDWKEIHCCTERDGGRISAGKTKNYRPVN